MLNALKCIDLLTCVKYVASFIDITWITSVRRQHHHVHLRHLETLNEETVYPLMDKQRIKV